MAINLRDAKTFPLILSGAAFWNPESIITYNSTLAAPIGNSQIDINNIVLQIENEIKGINSNKYPKIHNVDILNVLTI